MAKRLMSHFDQIVAWYDHEISTGPLEGINNKI
jgi:transposase